MLYKTPEHPSFTYPDIDGHIDTADQEAALYVASPEVRPLGYTLQQVEVPDVSELSEGFPEAHEKLQELDRQLKEHPEWEAPRVSEDGTRLILDKNNEATNYIYGEDDESDTTRQWYVKLVPSALALEALSLNSGTLPTTDIQMTDKTIERFLHVADARSIRTRGALMSELVSDHAAEKRSSDPQRWVSLACGAARPVLEAAARIKQENGTPIDVTLVDYDTNVLQYSSGLAESLDAVADHHELESNLMRTMIARDTLVDDLGAESMDVVDVLGFLEYCRDKQAVDMLRNSYKLVAPGGVLVTSNMRDDRPEKEIHLRGVGWPGVQMRSSDELVALVAEAGIDPAHVEAYQPDDGVYTVLRITKPNA